MRFIPGRIEFFKSMRTFCIKPLVFILLIGFWPMSGIAAQIVRLTVDNGVYPIGRNLEYVEDREKIWSIEDVCNETMSQKFLQSKKNVPSFGLSDSAFWVRFTLAYEGQENQVGQWYLELAHPVFDHVTFYYQDPGGNWKSKKAGRSHPFDQRDVLHQNIVFAFETPANKELTFYVRTESGGSTQFPMTLWSPVAFANKIHTEQFGLGLFYGAMLVMIFYNLFVYMVIKDRNYLIYVCYIVGCCFFQICADGLGNAWIWKDFPWWASRAIPFSVGFSTFWMLVMTRAFLETKQFEPFLDRVIRFFLAMSAVLMALSLFADTKLTTKIAVFMALADAIVVFTAAIRGSLKGHRPARFFLLAWSAFLAGIILRALMALAVLPPVFITEYGIPIGSVVQVVLLSLALADRFGQERKEKYLAQKIAMAQRENVLKDQRETMENMEQLNKIRDKWLQDALDALESLSAMTMKNAANAGQADTVMRDTRDVVKKADESARQLADSMDDMIRVSQETETVVKTIDGIAFQTNLLALNAAVEAARAGESGAGFAVVAEEVRGLAKRSAQAAKTTSEMIRTAIGKIQTGALLAAQTNDAFEEVAKFSHQAEKLVAKIYAASEEQAKGIERVNLAVVEMSRVAENTQYRLPDGEI